MDSCAFALLLKRPKGFGGVPKPFGLILQARVRV